MRYGLFSNRTDALRWLEGDECDYEVTRAYAVARRMGVTGVPFFVFGTRWGASGAVGVPRFLEVRASESYPTVFIYYLLVCILHRLRRQLISSLDMPLSFTELLIYVFCSCWILLSTVN